MEKQDEAMRRIFQLLEDQIDVTAHHFKQSLRMVAVQMLIELADKSENWLNDSHDIISPSEILHEMARQISEYTISESSPDVQLYEED